MTKSPLLIFLPLLFTGFARSVESQSTKPYPTNKQAEINRIKAYENEVIYFGMSHPSALRQLVKDSPKGSWREIKPGANTSAWHFLQADIGFYNGKLAHISMLQSDKDSGHPDSSILLFRPDGTLAKYILIVETWTNGKFVKGTGKIQYFNAQGAMLLTINASKDMKTGKITASPNLSRPWLPIYKKTSDLPFYTLLKTRLRTPDGKPVV